MKKNLRVEIDHLFPPERNVDPQLEIDMKKLRDWMEESKEKDRRKEEKEELIMRVLLIGTPIIALFLLGRAGFFDWRVAVAGFVAGYVVMTFLLRMRGG